MVSKPARAEVWWKRQIGWIDELLKRRADKQEMGAWVNDWVEGRRDGKMSKWMGECVGRCMGG